MNNPLIQSKAKTVLMDLSEAIFLMPDMPWITKKIRPGQQFESLPEETKEILRGLKSDELKDIRWPPWK